MNYTKKTTLFSWVGILLLGYILPAWAGDTVDFESTVLYSGTIVLKDGWEKLPINSGTTGASITASTNPTNRYVTISATTTTAATFTRAFTPQATIMDLQWRWRANGAYPRLCVGAATGDSAATLSYRAEACMLPAGNFVGVGAIRDSLRDLQGVPLSLWGTNKWYYMRLRMDNLTNTYTLYMDSISAARVNERKLIGPSPMNFYGSLTRVTMRTETGTTNGSTVGVDDIAWKSVTAYIWTGGITSSNWSNPNNWSDLKVPDSASNVYFNASGLNCFVDVSAKINSIIVTSDYGGRFDLGASILNIGGDAEFTSGGNFIFTTGYLRFSSPTLQLITSVPEKSIPPVVHDGTGTLRLARLKGALTATNFIQAGGTLDLNGYNLNIDKNFQILNGVNLSIKNLGGNTINVGENASMTGQAGNYLNLSPGIDWTIWVNGSLNAYYTALGNSTAAKSGGVCYQCSNSGSNLGWIFNTATPPVIKSQPANLTRYVGQAAVFSVSATSSSSMTFQWKKNNIAISGATDSVYTIPSVQLTDSGAVFTCAVSNSIGSQTSNAAELTVNSLARTLAAGQAINLGGNYNLSSPAGAPTLQVRLLFDSLNSLPGFRAVVTGFTVTGPAGGAAFPKLLFSSPPGDGYFFYSLSPSGSVTFLSGEDDLEITGPGTYFVGLETLAPKITLNGGLTVHLGNNYNISSPAGAPSVQVKLLLDSLKSLPGFQNILGGIEVTGPAGGAAFPKLLYSSPATDERFFYSLSAAGIITFLTGEDNLEISGPETIFLGVDTLEPKITFNGESFTDQDSTQTSFTIEDNISNPVVDLVRSDDPSLNLLGFTINTTVPFTPTLKNPDGVILPLTLRFNVSDHRRAAFFPSDEESDYFLSQKIGAGSSPSVLKIGMTTDRWDLVSVPLALNAPLTLSKLRQNNNAPDMAAAVWDNGQNQYGLLKSTDVLQPGKSVWLANTKTLNSLAFPALETSPLGDVGPITVTLHPGWNQISNPMLDTLFWPVPWDLSGLYDLSKVRRLYAYDADAHAYVQSDLLDPWRGYFVYLQGTQDTVVSLRSTLAPIGAAKISASFARPAGLNLVLGLDHGLPLRLGASVWAVDAAGNEDDPLPPSRGGGPSLWSLRQGKSLGTDLVKWAPGSVFHWKVVAGIPVVLTSENLADGETVKGIRVGTLDLPEGYEAWAVSAKRGLKFPLSSSGLLPLSPGLTDTLDVYVGATGILQARLKGIPEKAGAFKLFAVSAQRGFTLHLRTPESVRLRWDLTTPDGRVRNRGDLHLPEGIYELPQSGVLPGSLYFLRMEWQTGTTSGKMSRKLVIP